MAEARPQDGVERQAAAYSFRNKEKETEQVDSVAVMRTEAAFLFHGTIYTARLRHV